jgi:MFS family permease
VAALAAYTIGGGIGTAVAPRVARVIGLPAAMLAAAMLAAMTAAIGTLWLPGMLIPAMTACVGLLGSLAHQHRDHVFQDTVPCHQLRRTFAQWDGAGQVAWVLGAVASTFGGLLLVDAVRLTGTVALASALVAVALPQRRLPGAQKSGALALDPRTFEHRTVAAVPLAA